MFGKDILAWALEPHEDGMRVREVHLLENRTIWTGPWVFEKMWNRWQSQMRQPYPTHLRKPYELLIADAVRQERLMV